MKKKWILLGATALILLGLGGGTLLLNDDEQDDKSSLDKSIEQVSNAKYDKALQSVDKLKETEQEKNMTLYKKRISIIEQERQLVEEKKYSEARDLIKEHLEKHPVSEDEDLQLQLMLVEDMDKIDQLKKKDVKGVASVNKAINKNRNAEYKESQKIIDGLSQEDKASHQDLISKLEEANNSEANVDKGMGTKEKKLSEALNKNEVSIITQLKSDTSDNKNRGLVGVEISLLIKNESNSSLVVEPSQFMINNKKVTDRVGKESITILPGASYLLENILTDAQPEQLSGVLNYGTNKIGKLVDVERGYFEDDRWVQL